MVEAAILLLISFYYLLTPVTDEKNPETLVHSITKSREKFL